MAVNGQMKGKQLIRLPFDEGFWFEWIVFYPKTGALSWLNNQIIFLFTFQ